MMLPLNIDLNIGHSRTSSSSSTNSAVSEEEKVAVKKEAPPTLPKGKVDLNQYKEKEGFDMGGISGGTLKLAVKTDLAAKFEDKKTTEWTDDFDALDDALDVRGILTHGCYLLIPLNR